jgi:hypothetical protein
MRRLRFRREIASLAPNPATKPTMKMPENKINAPTNMAQLKHLSRQVSRDIFVRRTSAANRDAKEDTKEFE